MISTNSKGSRPPKLLDQVRAKRRKLNGAIEAVRARRPKRLPVVMSPTEVAALLGALTGVPGLICKLMYGSGLWTMECLRLRTNDIDFQLNQIMVRDGKGAKDRVTVFPREIMPELEEHRKRVKMLHWRTATTSGPCRSCWAIRMSAPT